MHGHYFHKRHNKKGMFVAQSSYRERKREAKSCGMFRPDLTPRSAAYCPSFLAHREGPVILGSTPKL